MSTSSPTNTELAEEVNRLRAALAAASGLVPNADDVTPDPEGTPAEGDVLHFLAPVIFAGAVRNRGEEVTVTRKIIDDLIDRNGISTLATLVDPEYQTSRYGHVVIARGPFPSNLERYFEKGDPQWTRERGEALDAANRIPYAQERTAAIAAVHARFGQPPAGWHEPQRPTRSKWAE